MSSVCGDTHGAFGATVITGNYPSKWMTPSLAAAVVAKPFIFMDTLASTVADAATVLLPSVTWVEKAGSFQNATDRVQAFERAIQPIDFCKSEAQIALDLTAELEGRAATKYDAERTRAEISAKVHAMFLRAAANPPLPPSAGAGAYGDPLGFQVRAQTFL